MPELPEVETIKRQLNRKIKGKKIKSVKINLPKLVKYPLKKFKNLVKEVKINNITRRAKLLIVELSNNYYLIIHLKLSGQLIFNGIISKHTHLVYYFTKKNILIHNDVRQFGFVKVISKDELDDFFEKERFGPEPLSNKFNLKLFKELLLKRKKSKIKIILMDQKFIAGIGNIYSDEILFFAGVLPSRKVETLKNNEIKRIFQGIKEILKLAIKKRGTSSRDYFDIYGKKGNYVPLLKVYQRGGKSCFSCKSKIKRIKMGSRSAHFCPKCQK
ncbi:bifunctional DNA-formamidopyrimidine glycosylase/DNA-(apurinic or apyrimidinic site) lyase [Patescibacteria group bacterium]|nr:bifunctional DNA-formamidopyrimidine glycosylase/DNA-(apurinic or apyrimidinic site) lyase [Patescibacteria group bacterium]